MSNIVWKSLLDNVGEILAPSYTLLAFRVNWVDEHLGQMFKVFPAQVVWEEERGECDSLLGHYPIIASVDDNDNVLAEEFGEQHTWCLWSDYRDAVINNQVSQDNPTIDTNRLEEVKDA